jgi:2'-5' RNA ligase
VQRLFVAVDPPGPERLRLAGLATPLGGARWVTAEHMHVTLRFLGSVAEGDVAGMIAALARIVAPRFELAFAGVGTFPPRPSSRKPAHVLWAGLAPSPALHALKAAVDAALGPEPDARPYAPHVTLARLRDVRPAELARFVDANREVASAPFPIDAFHLYESRDGVYTILRSFPLA